MPLLAAAMLLNFDIVPEAVAEHDDWHTHEHLPERLSIPGFLRGTRWLRPAPGPRTACCTRSSSSPRWLPRLIWRGSTIPLPWTQKMMPHYRACRGLCRVIRSCGLGWATTPCSFASNWCRSRGIAAAMAGRRIDAGALHAPGLGSIHLLQGGLTATMTSDSASMVPTPALTGRCWRRAIRRVR